MKREDEKPLDEKLCVVERNSSMRFEDLLVEIGGFGRFQKLVALLSFIGRFTLPCHFLLINYIAAIPSHHCDISFLDHEGVFGNLTREQKLSVSIPRKEDGTFASCHMFAEPQFQLLGTESNFTDVPLIQCPHGWEYDNSTFISSLSTKWDLVCEKRGMSKAVATIFFVGVMLGAAIFGSLSDRYGRKPMLLVSYVAGMIFAVASIFSSSFIMFAVLRFFTGLAITGIVIVSSVLNVEWVDIERRKIVGVIDSMSWSFGYMVLPVIAYGVRDWKWLTIYGYDVEWVDIKRRKIVGVIDSMSWSFGYMVLPVIAYGVRDWKWLTIAVTSPLVIAIISWRWVPESARWLIANGKVEKAHFYLKRCASMNKRKAATSSLKPEILSHIVSEGGNRKYSYLDLMRTPKMRRLAFLTGITWYGVASTFYGISFNIKGFGLDLYLTQFLYGFVEFPAKIAVYYLLDRIGRRKTEVGALLLAGICLLVNVFVSKDQWIVQTVIGVLGKGFASMAFSTLVLYSSELYPTVIRQNGMGYNSFLGRLGVAIAPLILLLDEVWGHLSQVILCAIALVAALAAYQLPETRGRCLPETIEDVEGTRNGQGATLKRGKEKEEQENLR